MTNTTMKRRLCRLEAAFAQKRMETELSARLRLLAQALSLQELEALEARLADQPDGATVADVLSREEFAEFEAKLAAAQQPSGCPC